MAVSEFNITQIRKRDGSVVPFDASKIERAIFKALTATKKGTPQVAADLTRRVLAILGERPGPGIPGVEEVQDIVETVLMAAGYPETARSYILYRQERADIRRLKSVIGVRDDLKLTVNAVKVLERRYLLRDEDGNIIETPSQLFRRVAGAIAGVEPKFNPAADVKALEDAFYSLMANREFMPNTPTLMNAGAPLGQLSACFVLPVGDSINDIFDTLKSMALIHQSGGGTGFSFSRLRPKGDMVRSTKGVASGPVSFMKIFDVATGVMKQGGKRRGANMGILNADHPDIFEFAVAKSDETTLSNFNISVGTTDEFMAATARNGDWPLINPRTGKEVRKVKAAELLELIVNNAWRTGDPGMVFLDEINRRNPTPHLGRLEATNPCGELPLLPFESCNLGSINLSRMVKDGNMDWEKLRATVHVTIHFLDNVIEANNFPLPQIEKITRGGNRKVGLGVMGFADALAMLGIPYNSELGLDMGERIISFISDEAHRASVDLAAQRGVFPSFAGSIYDRPDGMRMRNATVLSIAPTGTISIIAGCSSGIEPLFALAFVRNVMEGTRLLEVNPVFEQVARARGFAPDLMQTIAQKGTLRNIAGIPEDVRRVFVTDWDIAPEWHIRMQAIFQKYTDNSVSKTINLPAEATPQDIRRIYTMAHQLRCKGITVYRYGSKRQQVLTLAGSAEPGEEASPFVTVASEYAGGCATGTCPF